MPRDAPEDYGFQKTRGGTRWQEWKGHGYRIGVELVDEETGEWTAYYAPEASNASGAMYEDAFSEGAAMMHAVEFARRLSGGDDALVDPEFDFGGGL